MRPAGELRAALLRAMRECKVPVPGKVLAQRACVGFDAAQHTLANMVRDRAAVKAGTVRVPGVKRPVPVYALPGTVQLPLDLAA